MNIADPDVIGLLHVLVGINSVNPFSTVNCEAGSYESGEVGIGNEANLLAFCEHCFESWGFHTARQPIAQETKLADGSVLPERFNLLADIGKGPRSILFLGHADTVDVKFGWRTDPFTLAEDSLSGRSILRGLGVNDMKGGIAAFMTALSKAHPPDGWKIKVALVSDEEFWSFGADTLVNSSFLKDVRLAIVPEIGEGPGSDYAPRLGLGRLGRTEFQFDVIGRACNGADAWVDPHAINAVEESARLQAALMDWYRGRRKTFECEGLTAVNSAYVNQQWGGSGSLSVPDKAGFIVDRTFLPDESVEGELLLLRTEVNQLRSKLPLSAGTQILVSLRERPTPYCQPYLFSHNHPGVAFISDCIQVVTGKPTEYFLGRSVADENRLAAAGIPTLTLGPTGAGSHTPAEWVDEESLHQLVNIFENVLGRLASFDQ